MIRSISNITELIPLSLKIPFDLKKLIQNQQLKPKEIRRLQTKKLLAIIKHSYNYVPYYNSLLKKVGIKPNDINNIDRLQRIPISEKEDFVSQKLDNIVARNIKIDRCLKWSTSGTTGTPLVTYWTNEARLMDYMLVSRWQLNCGAGLLDKRISIGLDHLVNPFLFILGFARRVFAYDNINTQINEIISFKPKILLSYPSCLRILAIEILERKIKVPSVRTIFTSGELLDKYTRKLFEEVFNADVYDGYGTTETGGVSTECVKHAGYHIWNDSVLVEIVKDDEVVSFGEEGEIVVTNLFNYAMPIIRYNTKDLGIMIENQSTCQNQFPLMKVTRGRKVDIIKLPDSNHIPSHELVTSLLGIQGIIQFQVIQEDIDWFRIKIVKSSNFSNSILKEIKNNLLTRIKQRMNEKKISIKIEVLFVNNIPKEKSGKFKYFIACA
jgi:phenylacetate-CoA ligase